MATTTTAGTTLKILSGAPATYDIAGFTALTLITIGEVESLPEFGGSSQIGTFNAIDTIVTAKYKGAFDPGDLSITVARDIADAGQIIAQAGALPTNNVSHSCSLTDSAGIIVYFTALISSYTINPGDVNALYRSTIALNINNLVIAGQ